MFRVDFQPAVVAVDDTHFRAGFDVAERLRAFTRRCINAAHAGNFVSSCNTMRRLCWGGRFYAVVGLVNKRRRRFFYRGLRRDGLWFYHHELCAAGIRRLTRRYLGHASLMRGGASGGNRRFRQVAKLPTADCGTRREHDDHRKDAKAVRSFGLRLSCGVLVCRMIVYAVPDCARSAGGGA